MIGRVLEKIEGNGVKGHKLLWNLKIAEKLMWLKIKVLKNKCMSQIKFRTQLTNLKLLQ